MAPKTAAERQRQYRASLNADPEKREKYLEKERQRWRKNLEAGKKKGINELSERQQRLKRRKVESSLQKKQGEERRTKELNHSSTKSRSCPRAISMSRIFKVEQ